jgi:hypothetical protein
MVSFSSNVNRIILSKLSRDLMFLHKKKNINNIKKYIYIQEKFNLTHDISQAII